MGFFDTLGNFASRVGREAMKGVGGFGEFAGNIAGGAWSSFTDPGFNLPTTGGLGGKIGGLFGEAAETLVGGVFGGAPADPGPWGGSPGYPTGINPDLRAQRDLEIFLGRPATPTTGAPLGGYMTTELRPPGVAPGFLPGTEVVSPMMTNVALPGGALVGPLLGQLGRGALAGAGIGAGMQLFGGGEDLPDLPFGGRMFRQTAAGIRARSLVEVVNPVTGKKSWYRNVGRPILFSGDLRACRRVRKVAGRARRARGR